MNTRTKARKAHNAILLMAMTWGTSVLLAACGNAEPNNSAPNISVATSASSGQVTIEKTESGNLVITTQRFSGVILTKGQMEESMAGWAGEFWTPAVGAIVSLEEHLEDFLLRNGSMFHAQAAPIGEDLSAYRRQYYGRLENDRWLVFAYFFCSWEDVAWKDRFLVTSGGGDCYFNVEYDPDTEDFTKILVNDLR